MDCDWHCVADGDFQADEVLSDFGRANHLQRAFSDCGGDTETGQKLACSDRSGGIFLGLGGVVAIGGSVEILAGEISRKHQK